MKKLLFLPFFLLIFAVIVGVGGYFYLSSPVNTRDSSAHDFIVSKGQGVEKIGNNLEKEGVIKSGFIFRIYSQLTGKDKKIVAGQYKLSPNLTLDQVLNTLIAGPQELWVTMPEGLRREEVALRVIKSLDMKDAAAKTFYTNFMKETEGREGFLFPDTYLFPKEATAGAVVKKLLNTFDLKVTDQMEQDIERSGFNKDQIITLASIIERETITDLERPVVAGILIKRMEADWPLQTDATLQYIVGNNNCSKKAYPVDCDWWKIPTVKDKELKSSYNTYLNTGLPPEPIANPGISSINAAIYPEASEYWFYLHGSDGKIRYGKTAEEHGENIRKYL